MARNRKNQSEGFSFGRMFKAGVICFCIVISCVGYLWQKRQIAELSQQFRNLEKQREASRANNVKLAKQLGEMHSPIYLDARVKELKLGLAPVQPSQIWRLPEPSSGVAAQAHEPRYAMASNEEAAGEQ